jgi:hypothetical protein
MPCREIVFSFNKKHLEDPSIPMWKLSTKGESYYVNHVDCTVPWSTKETPDSSHTKGAIKLKNCFLTIGDDNCAAIRAATPEDHAVYAKDQTVRVITEYGNKLRAAIASMAHGAVKMAGGGCGTTWYITDIPSQKHFLMLQLQVPDIRILKPNEDYYKYYDRSLQTENDWIDYDEWDDLYDD